MPGSGLGVLEPPQGVPAGVKLGFGDLLRTFGKVGCGQLVGALDIALLIEPAADDAGFHPPFVRIDEH